MRRLALALAAVGAMSIGNALAKEAAVDIDFMAGEWKIFDAKGAEVGGSTIVVHAPDAMIYEERRVEDVQPLWFANAERTGGWTQFFVAVNGLVREFAPRSAPGAWPLVLGGDVTLLDGRKATFRMTLDRRSDDETRRVLEISNDSGATWKTVFDYVYRRVASSTE